MSDESEQSQDHARPAPAADPQSIEGLFLQALGQSPEQREAFLDEACGDDAERRRRIEALLRAYDDAGSFLEKPPVGVETSQTLSLDFLAPSDDPGLLGTLGPYEVYEVLGRGGMGIVFRARDPKLNRVVAIKVLAPELAANPNARRRFLREAQAAAAISHPHVVTIHAVDEGGSAQASPGRQSGDGGGSPSALNAPATSLPYIVMECIVGQTLQQKLDKQGSLRLTEILRIGHQTACGLAAAHKQGLIHRDIKPANILLENGIERVKITDFGLARAADDVSITRTGEVSGTPQYMSPEQASGGTIDHRSDLFSLGCVLYAMCTGRSPFRATTLAAAIRRVCDDDPRPIEEINPETPPWLIEIVNRLLAKNPDERFQSTDEVEQLLGEHLADIQQPAGRRTDVSTGRRESPVSRQSDAASRMAAEPSPAAESLTMPSVKARVTVWAGALLLLAPLFVWLIGETILNTSYQANEDMFFIVSLFCWPAGLLAIGFGSVFLLNPRSQLANALFIAICVLMGPIGILLYLIRHHHIQEMADSRQGPPPSQVAGGREARETSNHRTSEVPQWLLTPLPGPVRLLALLLGGIAAVVMGQAIEQWSDVDAATGIFLFINAAILSLLAWRIAVAAGVRFDGWKWMTLGLVSIPLMYIGAQAPSREFKQALENQVENTDTIAWITGGIALIAAWIWFCLHSSTRGSGGGRPSGERFGRGLVIGGVVLWALLAAWMICVAAGFTAPPPLAQREAVGSLIMAVVIVGGVMFAIGMIMARWVITPWMVHRLSDDLDSRQQAQQAAGSGPPQAGAAASQPWTLHDWARLLFRTGLIVLALPVLPILFGLVSGDGDPMELGGSLVLPAVILAGLAFVGGWITKLAAHSAEGPPPKREWSLVAPLGWLTAIGVPVLVAAAAIGWHSDQQLEAEFRERQRLRPDKDTQFIAPPSQPEREADGFPPMRVIPLSGKPGTIQFQTGGNIEIGRVTIDDEDVPLQQGVSGPGGGLVEVPAEPGHHNIMVVLQSDERYHFGVDVGDDKGAVVQVPPGGEGILQVDFADPQLGIQLRRRHQVEAQPEQMGMGGFEMSAADPIVTLTPLDPHLRGGAGGGFGGTGGPVEFTWVGNSGRYRVPSGTYDVWIADNLAGWCRAGSQQPVSYSSETITIAPGKSASLTVRRNLKPMVKMHGGLSDFRLYDFRWNGNVQTFTLPQAQVVERLFAAYADGEPDYDEKGLLTIFGPTPVTPAGEAEDHTPPESLKAIFDDGKHPAWGTIIVPGEGEGSYRLAELQIPGAGQSLDPADAETATLEIDFDDPGLHLYLEPEFVIPIIGPIDQPTTVTAAPGSYTAIVEDDLAGWHTRDENGELGPVRYESEKLRAVDGETTNLTVHRNLKRLAAAYPALPAIGTKSLRWNGQTYDLDAELQAPIVAALMSAYSHDVPDVHEGRLLTGITFTGRAIQTARMSDGQAAAALEKLREKGHSLKKVFDDGQHPAWGTLIVEGEAEHTYRLTELRDPIAETQSKPADAAGILEIAFDEPGLFLYLERVHADRKEHIRVFDESATITVDPGRYGGWIAGWHSKDRFDMPKGAVQHVYQEFDIRPGKSATLHVSRSVERMAATRPQRPIRSSQKFRWGQESYPLTPAQSSIVLILMDAYLDGEPEVHEAQLLKGTTLDGHDSDLTAIPPNDLELELEKLRADGHSVKGLFDDGEHKAWGTLIIAGEKPNTYRLAELVVPEPRQPSDTPQPGQSMLQIEFEAPGLHVVLEEDASRGFGDTDWKRFREELDEGTTVQLSPGRYRVVLQDDLAGWRTTTKYGEPDAVRYEFDEITLKPGETRKLTVDRNIYKMGAAHRLRPGKFLWNGQTYELSQHQGLAVARLLHALADGNFEVHEGRLLKQPGVGDKPNVMPPMSDGAAEAYRAQYAEQGNTLKGWFQSGQHPAWGTLVIEGEKPHTYRLAELQVPEPVKTSDTPRKQFPVPGGALKITVADEGLLVGVRRRQRSVFGGFQPGDHHELSESGQLVLLPGDYQVRIHDELFGWEEWSDHDQQVSVKQGQTCEITIARDFARLVCDEDIEGLDFHWNGKVYDNFERAQVLLVNRLLKALATDEPAIAEESLVKGYNEAIRDQYRDTNIASQLTEKTSLAEVFQGIGLSPANNPEPIGNIADWQEFLIPGQTEGTWRLKPPLEPEDAP